MMIGRVRNTFLFYSSKTGMYPFILVHYLSCESDTLVKIQMLIPKILPEIVLLHHFLFFYNHIARLQVSLKCLVLTLKNFYVILRTRIFPVKCNDKNLYFNTFIITPLNKY